MSQVGILALRGLAGGTFVVLFALLGEALRPKSLAGILSAAPSVALASLLVTSIVKGDHAVWSSALGMIVGAIALVAACAAGIDAVKRFRALRGSFVVVAVWLAVAFGLYAVVLG
jgi:hypothetical protein